MHSSAMCIHLRAGLNLQVHPEPGLLTYSPGLLAYSLAGTLSGIGHERMVGTTHSAHGVVWQHCAQHHLADGSSGLHTAGLRRDCRSARSAHTKKVPPPPPFRLPPLAVCMYTYTHVHTHAHAHMHMCRYEARGFLQAGSRPQPYAVHVAALNDDVLLMASCLAHQLDIDAPAPPEAAQLAIDGEWPAAAAHLHAGRTPLHIAAASGSEIVLELLLQNQAVSSAGVDSGDNQGKSALKLAVEAGEAGCVTQLITRGANISFADAAHQTPMQAASELGHETISESMVRALPTRSRS